MLAFLLGLPFTSRLSDLITLQTAVFYVAFLSSALAVVFLIAASAYHQLRGKP